MYMSRYLNFNPWDGRLCGMGVCLSGRWQKNPLLPNYSAPGYGLERSKNKRELKAACLNRVPLKSNSTGNSKMNL